MDLVNASARATCGIGGRASCRRARAASAQLCAAPARHWPAHPQPTGTQPGRRCGGTQKLAVAADAQVTPASVPASAETARTIVELVSSGTLSTLDASGTPLGTFVSFVLDAQGLPLLRLRKDAIHTQNLAASPVCSLFVHSPLQPVRSVGRITMIGAVEEIYGEEKAAAQAQHAAANADAIGVDAPREDDLFMRLKVDRTFYVGGLGMTGVAEELPVEEYMAAEVDTLAEHAPELVAFMNSERPMDLLRITGDVISEGDMDDVTFAELLWVDKLGVYVQATIRGEDQIVRVNFTHEAIDERDAKSCLTMMAQLAWENERSYKPSPIPLPKTDA